MGRHILRPGSIGRTGFQIQTAKQGKVGKRPVNPPAKKEERHRDQWNDHDVFHQGVHIITPTAGGDFI